MLITWLRVIMQLVGTKEDRMDVAEVFSDGYERVAQGVRRVLAELLLGHPTAVHQRTSSLLADLTSEAYVRGLLLRAVS